MGNNQNDPVCPVCQKLPDKRHRLVFLVDEDTKDEDGRPITKYGDDNYFYTDEANMICLLRNLFQMQGCIVITNQAIKKYRIQWDSLICHDNIKFKHLKNMGAMLIYKDDRTLIDYESLKNET